MSRALERCAGAVVSSADALMSRSRRDIPMVRGPESAEDEAPDRANSKQEIPQLAPDNAFLSSV
jgi:hypothetical protein